MTISARTPAGVDPVAAHPTTHTVLLYSDDPAVRDRIRQAIGTKPAADLTYAIGSVRRSAPVRRRT